VDLPKTTSSTDGKVKEKKGVEKDRRGMRRAFAESTTEDNCTGAWVGELKLGTISSR